MKKLLALLLCITIVCASFGCAMAEEEKKTSWQVMGSFISGLWNDLSDWAKDAWKDASKWIGETWGGASKWISRAWNETSSWVVDIWGDVSSWASEKYSSTSEAISSWLVETFETVTDETQETWEWLQETKQSLPQYQSLKEKLQSVLSDENGDESTLKETFEEILRYFGIVGDKAEKIWDTIGAYADEKGISRVKAIKLCLPYMLQLVQNWAQEQGTIPAIAIAQYLVGVFEKLGIDTNETADDLIQSLQEALSGN